MRWKRLVEDDCLPACPAGAHVLRGALSPSAGCSLQCSRLLRPSLFIGDGDMHASSTYIIHASRVQDHHHEAFWLDRQGMTDEMSTSGGQSMHTIEELERNIYRPRHACVAFRAANNNWGHKENVGYENVARCVPHKKKTSTSRTS